MKITLPRRRLLSLLSFSSSAVSGKSTLPILSHVCLTQKEGKLRVAATDLEVWMAAVGACQVEHELTDVDDVLLPTIPAKTLTGFVQGLREGDVTLAFESGSNKIQITSGRASVTLLGLPAEDYPGPPEKTLEATLQVNGKRLKDLLRVVATARSTDETRVALTGVYLQCDHGVLRATATDTHRLAMARTCIGDKGVNFAQITPPRGANELTKHVLDEAEVTLSITSFGLTAEWAEGKDDDLIRFEMLTRKIEGQYPNYERVIPNQNDKEWSIERKELIDSVGRLLLVAADNANRIVFTTEGQTLVITAQSGTTGNSREEIEVARSGDDLQIALNAKYLREMLQSIPGDGVKFSLSEGLRPILVTPSDESDAIEYSGVLMPMQVIV